MRLRTNRQHEVSIQMKHVMILWFSLEQLLPLSCPLATLWMTPFRQIDTRKIFALYVKNWGYSSFWTFLNPSFWTRKVKVGEKITVELMLAICICAIDRLTVKNDPILQVKAGQDFKETCLHQFFWKQPKTWYSVNMDWNWNIFPMLKSSCARGRMLQFPSFWHFIRYSVDSRKICSRLLRIVAESENVWNCYNLIKQ